MKASGSVERVEIHEAAVEHSSRVFRSRPSIGAVWFVAIAGLLQWLAPEPFKLLSPLNQESTPASAEPSVALPQKFTLGESELTHESVNHDSLAQPEKVEAPTLSRGPLATEASDTGGMAPNPEAPPRRIEHLEALEDFYASLRQTESHGSHALSRIIHFGDSVITSDLVSATLRRNFQQRFGDGGHGFSLIANAWPAYFHNDVFRYASEGWLVSRIVGPTVADAWYGLGGVSFRAPPGVRARFGTATSGPFGRKVSRFEVAYVKEPYGGKIKLNLDGKPLGELATAAQTKQVANHEVRTTDGEHLLELLSAGPGSVRAFGVVMEREGPGVVLDAIGILGARIRFLDKQDDTHYREQLRWRAPSLIIYQFGANESGDGWAYSMEDFHRTMKDVLLQGRSALPHASCLIIAAMDRARVRDGRTESMRIIPLIVKEQESVAKEVGCAFFNTFLAMGGSGAMRRWVTRGWGAGDLTHPTSYGAQVIGDWIFSGMMDGYARYQKVPAQP